MIYFRKHTLVGSQRCVSFRAAYERAHRLTKVFCRLHGVPYDKDYRGRFTVDVHGVFWHREAVKCIRESEFIFEDELPDDMSKEDRDHWWCHSSTFGGRRYGPTIGSLYAEPPSSMPAFNNKRGITAPMEVS